MLNDKLRFVADVSMRRLWLLGAAERPGVSELPETGQEKKKSPRSCNKDTCETWKPLADAQNLRPFTCVELSVSKSRWPRSCRGITKKNHKEQLNLCQREEMSSVRQEGKKKQAVLAG